MWDVVVMVRHVRGYLHVLSYFVIWVDCNRLVADTRSPPWYIAHETDQKPMKYEEAPDLEDCREEIAKSYPSSRWRHRSRSLCLEREHMVRH